MRMRMLIALLVCVGCGKNTEPPPPSSGSPMAQPESGPKTKKTAGGDIPDQARNMFNTVCATCHGADGSGNGPAAEALTVKPRNYTDAAWQASVTDDDIRTIILKGGQAVGKSALMPGNPHLEQQPEVVDGLVRLIRSFGKK